MVELKHQLEEAKDIETQCQELAGIAMPVQYGALLVEDTADIGVDMHYLVISETLD